MNSSNFPASCAILGILIFISKQHFVLQSIFLDRLCGLVVRVLGYRSGGPGSIPGTTRFLKKKKRKTSSGSETGSTQPREYN
jgi:hypothetical protein